MNQLIDTFITIVGCMDGRVQEPLSTYGRTKFKALYADTITDPGEVGYIANELSDEDRYYLKCKIDISLDKHKSKGVVVSGHADCAGNPVDDARHIDDIRRSVKIVEDIVGPFVPVVGVFVTKTGDKWKAEEVY